MKYWISYPVECLQKILSKVTIDVTLWFHSKLFPEDIFVVILWYIPGYIWRERGGKSVSNEKLKIFYMRFATLLISEDRSLLVANGILAEMYKTIWYMSVLAYQTAYKLLCTTLYVLNIYWKLWTIRVNQTIWLLTFTDWSSSVVCISRQVIVYFYLRCSLNWANGKLFV